MGVETLDDSTSHIVCGDSRRTMNVMKGLVRGLKIVSLQWVHDSLREGHWHNEELSGGEVLCARTETDRETFRWLRRVRQSEIADTFPRTVGPGRTGRWAREHVVQESQSGRGCVEGKPALRHRDVDIGLYRNRAHCKTG